MKLPRLHRVLLSLAGFFLLISCSCSMPKILPKPSVKKVEMKSSIIMYEFQEYFHEGIGTGNYCPESCILITPRGEKILFYDDYELNYSLGEYLKKENINVYERLIKRLLPEEERLSVSLKNQEDFDSLSYVRRLTNSPFKTEKGNEGGNYFIYSNSIYGKASDEFKLYIAFKVDCKLFFYQEVSYFIEANLNKHYYGGCFFPMKDVNDDFFVIDKAYNLRSLNTKEKDALRLEPKKLNKINLIIFE